MLWPCVANAEGGLLDRFLRTSRKTIKPPIRAIPMTPPTTPPAIVPAFAFEVLETFVEENVLDETDMRVDSVPLVC